MEEEASLEGDNEQVVVRVVRFFVFHNGDLHILASVCIVELRKKICQGGKLVSKVYKVHKVVK